MIDTLNIELRQQDAPGIDFVRAVESCLTNRKEIYYDERPNSVVISGDFFGLGVRVSENSISFNGSIHKFIKGNNIEPLTRQEIEDVIKLISNGHGLPLKRAIVRRVDVGAALVVENPPRRYIDTLGRLEGFSCNPYSGGGVYYSDRGGSDTGLCIYDKIAEIRAKKHAIPPDYAERYILRYELRHIKGHTPGAPGRVQTVEQLLAVDSYNALCREWARRFKEINKIASKNEYDMTTNIKAARDIALINQILANGGIEQELQRLEGLYRAGRMNKYELRDYKKALKKTWEAYGPGSSAETEELEEKIRLALLAGGVPPEDEEPHDIEAAG